jgi:hypothetical protein
MNNFCVVVAILLAVEGAALAANFIIGEGSQFKKYDLTYATRVQTLPNAIGELAIGVNSNGCSVFMNATSLTKMASTVGYPLRTTDGVHNFSVRDRTHLSFTCTTSAGYKSIFIAK